MNLLILSSKFSPYVEVLVFATGDIYLETTADAVEDPVGVIETVVVDGIWQNRGHTSLNGVVTYVILNYIKYFKPVLTQTRLLTCLSCQNIVFVLIKQKLLPLA